MKKVNAYSLSEDLIEKIKQSAEALGLSQSEIVQHALVSFFEKGGLEEFIQECKDKLDKFGGMKDAGKSTEPEKRI